MRILVHEFVTGRGLSGREFPASFAREGAAMRAALIADLAAIGRHEIVTSAESSLDAAIASVDAVWVIAPETYGCLERLAARVERHGKVLLGSSAEMIGRASNKAALARLLATHGIRHPKTRLLRAGAAWSPLAPDIGYPLVVKPTRGAGCQGVSLVHAASDMPQAIETARRASAEAVLLQRYVDGTAASVSLLADGRRATPLMINAQDVRGPRLFSYEGGSTPFDHPLADEAVDAAVRTCEALPGLRGYVGVDLVLTASEAFVIEVNPRLTTAYLGVRSVLDENVAELAIAACEGHLPGPLYARQSVRFTAAGEVMSA